MPPSTGRSPSMAQTQAPRLWCKSSCKPSFSHWFRQLCKKLWELCSLWSLRPWARSQSLRQSQHRPRSPVAVSAHFLRLFHPFIWPLVPLWSPPVLLRSNPSLLTWLSRPPRPPVQMYYPNTCPSFHCSRPLPSWATLHPGRPPLPPPRHPPIPPELVEQIQQGEFIDHADLLPDSLRDNELPQELLLDNQHLLIPKQAQKREVRNIITWVDCWTAYSLVLLSGHPDRAVELLKCQDVIIRTYGSFPRSDVWLRYDRNFRRKAACSPVQLDWGATDLEVLHKPAWAAMRSRPHLHPTPLPVCRTLSASSDAHVAHGITVAAPAALLIADTSRSTSTAMVQCSHAKDTAKKWRFVRTLSLEWESSVALWTKFTTPRTLYEYKYEQSPISTVHKC